MSNWGTPARTIRYGWHTEERTYGPNGELIACLIDGVVMDTRDIAPNEQDLMVQRLNERLREGRWDRP